MFPRHIYYQPLVFSTAHRFGAIVILERLSVLNLPLKGLGLRLRYNKRLSKHFKKPSNYMNKHFCRRKLKRILDLSPL